MAVAARGTLAVQSSLLLLLCCLLAGAATAQPCSPCLCLGRKVTCNQVELPAMPTTASEYAPYAEVEFRHIPFASKALQRRNLTALSHVEALTITACGIESIEPQSFSGMTRLKKLDLSDNNLGRLEPRTFDGLVVEHLFLNRNPRLDISSTNTFSGLRTEGLYLSQCGLTELSAEHLRPVERSLKVLWLEGNNLRRLDPGIEPLLRSLVSVKIGDNPFDCGCQMLWFKRLVDEYLPTQASGGKFSSALQMRCSSPAYLLGSFLTKISERDMTCSQQSLDLSFAPATGELLCSSRALPQAALYVATPGGVSHHQARGTGDTNVASVPVQPGSRGIYSCMAVNVAGNLSVSVNVTMPAGGALAPFVQPESGSRSPGVPPLPTTSRGDSTDAGTRSSACAEQATPAAESRVIMEKVTAKQDSEVTPADIFTAKYFSLVDILCAALGTFLGTLTVCVLVLHFCVYRRRTTAAMSTMSSPPPSDYSAGSMKGYPPPLPSTAGMQLRTVPPTHFMHHKPMYDPDNHYMTTNLEEVEFLHPQCQACTMNRIS